jgi:hypothetical protein
MATPLVNPMTDLWWVINFLERPEWQDSCLPPDCFWNTCISDNEDIENSNEKPTPGSNPYAVWAQGMNPYKEDPKD